LAGLRPAAKTFALHGTQISRIGLYLIKAPLSTPFHDGLGDLDAERSPVAAQCFLACIVALLS
jgi:hypothetical protein